MLKSTDKVVGHHMYVIDIFVSYTHDNFQSKNHLDMNVIWMFFYVHVSVNVHVVSCEYYVYYIYIYTHTYRSKFMNFTDKYIIVV